MEPAKLTPPQMLQKNLTAVATWNINGFWSKSNEVKDLLVMEKVAVLALQETLVGRTHYPIQMGGYRVYQSAVEEEFRGIAMLVDKRLASYEVPHGLNWMIHVKVFGYAGWSGPMHFFGVYLKSAIVSAKKIKVKHYCYNMLLITKLRVFLTFLALKWIVKV